MLSERAVDLCLGNKGFFIYHFIIPKKNGMSCFVMNLKSLNQFITCTGFEMPTLKHIMETIHLGHWAVLLEIKSAYCHIPYARGHCCFLCFRGKMSYISSGPSSKDIYKKITKPIIHHCWKIGKTLFLYLDDAFILAVIHASQDRWAKVSNCDKWFHDRMVWDI